jgi:imidazolonepropionase-like amidohydrolase
MGGPLMSRRNLALLSLVVLSWASTAPSQERAAADRTTVVEADRIVVAPDTVLSGPDARIAFRAGKITAVGSEIPMRVLETSRRVRLPGAVVVPGFVDAHDHLSSRADLAEQIDASTPELLAAEAFDPFDQELARRARGGITSIGLAPASTNVFGGLAAVVQWNGEQGVVTREASYLKMAIVAESLDPERYPTSRMGAADLVRSRFEAARGPLRVDSPANRVLSDVLSGARKVVCHARTDAELCAALDLADELSIRPIVLGTEDAWSRIDRVRRSAESVALAPLTWDSRVEQLEVPARLRALGVPFSFVGGDADRLRLAAALCVRHGVDRATALAALTRVPAEQCGMADTIGGLRVGCNADFLVFDGDPTDLASRLAAVWIGGQRVDDTANPTRSQKGTESPR